MNIERQWGIELAVVMCVRQIHGCGQSKEVRLRQARDSRTRTRPNWDQSPVGSMESLTETMYSMY